MQEAFEAVFGYRKKQEHFDRPEGVVEEGDDKAPQGATDDAGGRLNVPSTYKKNGDYSPVLDDVFLCDNASLNGMGLLRFLGIPMVVSVDTKIAEQFFYTGASSTKFRSWVQPRHDKTRMENALQKPRGFARKRENGSQWTNQTVVAHHFRVH